jgi:hypothetical protein
MTPRFATADVIPANNIVPPAHNETAVRLAHKRSDLACDDRHVACRARPVFLSDFTERRREAIRPPEFRGENFERDFDSATLFYDAVQVSDSQVAVFAPPFLNLSNAVAATTFRQGAKRSSARTRRLDRHTQLWLDIHDNGASIQADSALGNFEISVSRNESRMFRDCRVIFTMSKDNPIEWVLDWVRFNRDVHGADAVLIYDNGSGAYDSAALSSALGSVSGLRCSVVMEWPFKYGPQGTNSRDHWDSDFCQLGAWEHARWRFLQDARSVMNSDIDELVLSRTNKSVFEAAEQSWSGLVRYPGRWIIGVDDGGLDNSANAPQRHFDFSILMPPKYQRAKFLMLRDTNGCPAKWTVVPNRCPAHAQWHVHSISRWWASYFCTRDFSFRHFREIGSNWKYQRTNRVLLDPSIHEADSLLKETFRRVDWVS